MGLQLDNSVRDQRNHESVTRNFEMRRYARAPDVLFCAIRGRDRFLRQYYIIVQYWRWILP